ncbi:uncharacterized protein LOC103700150 [Phoenix dactylifera]|uniref:Uncharacterized protein LOC103700150 n=1 Tax=Phoenix dactylifera TaxID=42345 RepID=A0A8B7BL03_PHODC|nr:uncharacterized protein LOC103700150 [Phoenix dactylifera]
MTQYCEVCPDIEESICHVLLHYPRAVQIWSSSSAPLPSRWESVKDLLLFLRDSSRRPSTTELGVVVAYLAYHIWLDRDNCLFERRGSLPRLVMDRAVPQAMEVSLLAPSTSFGLARDIWGTYAAVVAPKYASLSWVLPPPGYLKVNFDGGMAMDSASGRVGFVIRDHDGRLIAAGGRSTPGLTAVGAELRAAWEGILYVRHGLGVDKLCIERDSATVTDWI